MSEGVPGRSPASDELIWLSEAQVGSLVDLNDAMSALRVGFIEEAVGEARTIDKALGVWPDGAIHALGSLMPGRGYGGFKTWAHTVGGATAIFSLFDLRNGRLLAVLEAATLGQIRTSAVSGLGADVLADPAADELAIIGTGAQALTQVAAVAAVRRLKKLRVFSPNEVRRAAFVQRIQGLFEFEVVNCGSVAEAVRGAPIVTLITRTTQPFLKAEMVADGALVIAAGGILPANAECFPDVLGRATSIVVDSLGNARTGSRELNEYFGADEEGWGRVKTLGVLLNSNESVAYKTSGLAFFKPMGSGLSDLAVAIMAYEYALQQNLGIHIKQPHRVVPKWRVAPSAAA